MSGLVAVPAVAVRFFSKAQVNEDSGCWEWTAAQIGQGYGVFREYGRNVRAHRWAYVFTRGPIPDGLVIDHLCRNRLCVNPDHLQAVTVAENNRRGVACGPSPVPVLCKQGHDLSGDNLILYAHRRCRTCVIRWNREYWARRGSALAKKKKAVRP